LELIDRLNRLVEPIDDLFDNSWDVRLHELGF
jgi:hypothetical protein